MELKMFIARGRLKGYRGVLIDKTIYIDSSSSLYKSFPTIFVIFIDAHTGLGYALILKMICVPSYETDLSNVLARLPRAVHGDFFLP